MILRRSAIQRVAILAAGIVFLLGCSGEDSRLQRDGGMGGDPGAAAAGIEGPLDAAQMQVLVTEALSIADTLDRTIALIQLLQRMDAGNVDGAALAFESRNRSIGESDAVLFANAWARIDPEAAIERAQTWRNPRVFKAYLSEVLTYWATNGDPAEARDYALATLEGGGTSAKMTRNVIVDSTLRSLAAAQKYDELTTMLSRLPSGADRNYQMTLALRSLYQGGESDVRAWVDSVPWDAPNDFKPDLLRVVLGIHARYDGAQAAEWYESAEDRLAPEDALEGLVLAWAATEPVSAAEWTLERPPSMIRTGVLQRLAFQWLASDGVEASTWIEAHLEDPEISTAMRFPLAQYLMSVDVLQALPVAERIENDAEKTAAMKQLLVRWSRTDYDAVKRYMAENPVSRDVEDTVHGQAQMRVKKTPKQSQAEAEG